MQRLVSLMIIGHAAGVAAKMAIDRHLVACLGRSRTTFRAGHPGWLRCSSLKYSRYSRSSRLAIRAPRSGIWSLFDRDRPLAVQAVDSGALAAKLKSQRAVFDIRH